MAQHAVSRRDAIRYFGLMTVAVAATACTPLRILTRAYPDAFEDDRELVDRVLRGFVTAVIPGARPDAPDLVRAYRDPALPFAPYAAFFAADLCRRCQERFGHADFHRLVAAERSCLIADGLAADATTRKLYNGAIYLAQVSFYAGIYDDDNGCALIDFPGRYRGAAATYDEPERFCAPALTNDGNFS